MDNESLIELLQFSRFFFSAVAGFFTLFWLWPIISDIHRKLFGQRKTKTIQRSRQQVQRRVNRRRPPVPNKRLPVSTLEDDVRFANPDLSDEDVQDIVNSIMEEWQKRIKN